MIRDSFPELTKRTAYPDLASLRRNSDITKASFDRFVAWLDPDEEKAGERYRVIHDRLIKFFTCRGCECPEDLADETINRVTIKARDFAESYEGVPERYFYGVGRKVFLEYTRPRRTIHTPPMPDSPERKELELVCLEQCLQERTTEEQKLILDYHREEKRAKINLRKYLARELGIEDNALRIRIHRLLARLRECVFKCLARAEIS